MTVEQSGGEEIVGRSTRGAKGVPRLACFPALRGTDCERMRHLGQLLGESSQMMTANTSKSVARPGATLRLISAAGLLSLALSGCSSGNNPFGGLGLASTEEALPASAANQAAKALPVKLPAVALAPLIGAPANVSSPMTGALKAALAAKNVPVAASSAAAAYTIRGYVAALPQKNSTKIAYIWDVMDKNKKRVHRIKDQEIVAGKAGKNPWSNVSPQVIQSIGSKAAERLAQWLPSQVSPQALASRAGSTAKKVKLASAAPATTAALPKTPAAAAPLFAMVPSVSGAPGDGSSSLRAALQKQLASKGVKLTSSRTANTYTVKGNVKMGAASGGKQQVKIDWDVLSPDGRKVGTVSQKNAVPAGSLDGSWGKIADAAAGAAASGIVKLLPKSRL